MDTGCEKKQEQTLRSAIEKCEVLFNKQRELIDSRFERNPKCEPNKKCEVAPTTPNVLDEYIDRLAYLANKQEELIRLIEKQIINKV